MINVTIGESKTQSENYPKIMISSNASDNKTTIVLFTSYSCGICLQKGKEESCVVGEYCEDWYMPVFTDYNEPITLQNA